MFDNTPGFDFAGDVQTDFGHYGLPLNDTGSKWDRADSRWLPPRHDPSLSNAARMNYAGGFGGGQTEGFATKRVRFSLDPTLLARKRGLDASLDQIGMAGGPPGDDGNEQVDDAEARAWAGQPPIVPLSCGQGSAVEGFSGRRRTERLEGDSLSDLLSDHNLLVLIFVLVLFLVVQAMISGAVRAALAEGVHGGMAGAYGD